jgi:hypothetical protein
VEPPHAHPSGKPLAGAVALAFILPTLAFVLAGRRSAICAGGSSASSGGATWSAWELLVDAQSPRRVDGALPGA